MDKAITLRQGAWLGVLSVPVSQSSRAASQVHRAVAVHRTVEKWLQSIRFMKNQNIFCEIEVE
jgi:hypothetical protein